MYQGITSYNSNSSSSKFYYNYDVVSYDVPTKEELEARKEAVKHLSYNVPTAGEHELFKLLTNPKRTFMDIIMTMPQNDIVQGNIAKAWTYLNKDYKGPIVVSVSGGSDSDVVIDIVRKCMINPKNEVIYIFINTGLESKATHEHLDYLESRYGIQIRRLRAKTPIPVAVRKHGIPFVSKRVSEYIERLQRYHFEWEDADLTTLLFKYCEMADYDTSYDLEHGLIPKGKWVEHEGLWFRGCVQALKWWCNANYDDGKLSRFNIAQNTWLKEFILQERGIPFKVSNKCCKESKKNTIYEALEELNPGLSIQGVRQAEGGDRATAYKSCFTEYGTHSWSEYRPVFWFSNKDKADYVEYCGIKHSALYDYQKRTGCAGCPFSRDLNTEREALHALGEDNMIKAMDFVFGPSYEFTKKYREFQKKMKSKSQKESEETLDLTKCEFYQMNIFDFIA